MTFRNPAKNIMDKKIKCDFIEMTKHAKLETFENVVKSAQQMYCKV